MASNVYVPGVHIFDPFNSQLNTALRGVCYYPHLTSLCSERLNDWSKLRLQLGSLILEDNGLASTSGRSLLKSFWEDRDH